MIRGVYTIQEVANEVGCPVRTIRFYKERGYIPPAVDADKSGRNYTDTHIKLARQLYARSEFKRIPIRELAETLNQPHNPRVAR